MLLRFFGVMMSQACMRIKQKENINSLWIGHLVKMLGEMENGLDMLLMIIMKL